MDPNLLQYYNRELQFIREMGGEFADEFPKIASRLGLDGFECADPYVERLLEGFSFLAARVQLRIDSEFPKFTQNLLEMLCPHYLAPTPSMAVVQLNPDLNEGSLAEGFVVPRETVLRSIIGKGEQTACEYRTAHDVTLWPLTISDAHYMTDAGTLPMTHLPHQKPAKAGIRFRLKTSAGLSFDQLALDHLTLYLRGSDETSMRIYEQVIGNAVGMVVRSAQRPIAWQEVIKQPNIARVGFEDNEALLPYGPRSFQGYRLLQEYFAFPERYMFIDLFGLNPAFRRCKDQEIEIVVLLDRSDPALERSVVSSQFALFCTPAINLFPKRADRIHLSDRYSKYHVVPDRTRPLDFEVYGLNSLVAHGTSREQKQVFSPFYTCNDFTNHREDAAYYAIHREPKALSSKERRDGPRSSYTSSEVFVSLVDSKEAPYSTDLKQLALQLTCTNRDLPLHMPIGKGKSDFTLESGAPVETVKCLAGPTKPRASQAVGGTAWKLVSHLSLNYLSLMDSDEKQGAAALRELLTLYGDQSEAAIAKQIEGLKSVKSKPIIRRSTLSGPITFGRGLEVEILFNEAAFEGTGFFLLGAVLEQFFAKYVSINSFTETVVKTVDRGEVIRWPIRSGWRHML